MAQTSPGPIVLPSDVAFAVKDTLATWVPYYLREIDDQQGRDPGTTTPPRSWSVSTEMDRWLEETPPAGLVVPGGLGDMERHGKDASYGGWFRVNIGISAGGATEEGIYDVASRLVMAVAATFAQQADMGGLAQDARFIDANTAPTRNRKLVAAEIITSVYVRRIVASRGPLLPLDPESNDFDQPSDSRILVNVRET